MQLNYNDCQERLANYFIHEGTGPVVFFVDDEELERIFPESADPAADLAAAVRTRSTVHARPSIFSPIERGFADWLRGPKIDCPPVLPLLAVTVLAATRMVADLYGSSTNYYLRLAQVLLPESGMQETEHLREILKSRDSFASVPDMWEALHEWISTKTELKRQSTIRNHTSWVRIGYSLSQALVRRSDHAALSRFYKACEIGAEGCANGAINLVPALRVWTASKRNSLSAGLQSSLRNESLTDTLESVLLMHASAWDGRVIDVQGRSEIRVRLGLDLDEWLASWHFVQEEGGPDHVVLQSRRDGREIELHRVPGNKYYDTHGAVVMHCDDFSAGLHAIGEHVSATFKPESVTFFRLDEFTGQWTSRSAPRVFEEHIAIVHSEHVRDFEQLLISCADRGWRIVKQGRNPLIRGYALFESVVFRANGLADAGSIASNLKIDGIISAAVPRTKLLNGLPVARQVSMNHFLVGGAPDLLLPFGAAPEKMKVRLTTRRASGETVSESTFNSRGIPIPLREIILEEGSYVIEAVGQRVTFSLVDEAHVPVLPNPGRSLGWNRLSGFRANQEAARDVVVGAALGLEDSARVLLGSLDRGVEKAHLLIDGGGSVLLQKENGPNYLSNLENPPYVPPRGEIVVPQNARWLAQRIKGQWCLEELNVREQRKFYGFQDVLGPWGMSQNGANSERLWEMFLKQGRVAR